MMNVKDAEIEEALLESRLSYLEADGFKVFIRPSREVLPEFMKSYRPDAIARRGDEKIAIEVVSDPRRWAETTEQLRNLFAQHPDWKLELMYIPPQTEDLLIEAPSKEAIERNVERLSAEIDALGPAPALLAAWSAFEAAARLLAPNRLARPQPAARLLEVLASEGYLNPEEADGARRIAHVRNRAAHGDFGIVVSVKDVDFMMGLIRSILAQAPGGSAPTPTPID
jgi:hypothetical protein